MNLSSKDLINLPVYTESGKFLGKVVSFEVEQDTQQIAKYYIKAGNIAADLLGESKELIVAQKQVISLTEEKMVVEDIVAKDLGEEKLEESESNQAMPAMPSQQN